MQDITNVKMCCRMDDEHWYRQASCRHDCMDSDYCIPRRVRSLENRRIRKSRSVAVKHGGLWTP